MKREDALDQIYKAVCKDRQNSYGPPEDSFSLIAELWHAYLSRHVPGPLLPHDVAAMMALLKVARIAFNAHNQDNWIDLGGYAVCGAELAPQLQQNNTCESQSESCKAANPVLPANADRMVDVGEAIALSRMAHKLKGISIGKFTKEQIASIDFAILHPQSFTFNNFMELCKLQPQ